MPLPAVVKRYFKIVWSALYSSRKICLSIVSTATWKSTHIDGDGVRKSTLRIRQARDVTTCLIGHAADCLCTATSRSQESLLRHAVRVRKPSRADCRENEETEI